MGDVVRIHEKVPPVVPPESTGVTLLEWKQELHRRTVNNIVESCISGPIAITQSIIGAQIFFLHSYQQFLVGVYENNARLLGK